MDSKELENLYAAISPSNAQKILDFLKEKTRALPGRDLEVLRPVFELQKHCFTLLGTLPQDFLRVLEIFQKFAAFDTKINFLALENPTQAAHAIEEVLTDQTLPVLAQIVQE
jgi:hypothetical protein